MPDLRAPVTAYVAVGANLGDPAAAVSEAIEALGSLPRTRLIRRSALYRTAPVDAEGPDFINAVAEILTGLSPHDLLAALQALEQAAGRSRPWRNAPRTLDLDLLLHGQTRVDDAQLTLPHPRMHERAFVLVPLAEIAPQQVDAASLRAVAGQRIERLTGR